MATDKSAPALPKVGEVWVACARHGGHGFLTAVDVLEPGPYYHNLYVTTIGGVHGAVTWSRERFDTFCKRAVRVDDKEAGR